MDVEDDDAFLYGEQSPPPSAAPPVKATPAEAESKGESGGNNDGRHHIPMVLSKSLGNGADATSNGVPAGLSASMAA